MLAVTQGEAFQVMVCSFYCRSGGGCTFLLVECPCYLKRGNKDHGVCVHPCVHILHQAVVEGWVD